jgi:Arc/MetJ family transcription regulator
MRTTVDLDSDLLAEAVRRSGGSSRKAVLESALRLLIEQRASEELAAMFGIAGGKAKAPRRRRSS